MGSEENMSGVKISAGRAVFPSENGRDDIKTLKPPEQILKTAKGALLLVERQEAAYG